MIFFGLIFLKNPYPYGEISLVSLTILIAGALLIVSSSIILKKIPRQNRHLNRINT
jgi:hypothetical protein